MVNLGLVVFNNSSGLGIQTRRLAEMLNPFRVLVVNASSFSKNKEQNDHWYSRYAGYKVDGFPSDREYKIFLRGLTHVLICENPLNPNLTRIALKSNVKVFIQANYEFCDFLIHPDMVLPYKFLMPSHWMVDEMKNRFGADRIVYLPPPLPMTEFALTREYNLTRIIDKPRLLHMVGTLAAEDRNGTLDILKALPFIKSDFELVIHSQHPLPADYIASDNRLTYSIGSKSLQADIYHNYDALILPRRYAGLCLPMWEALACGMPVFMTDICPNQGYLPKEWLVPARKIKELLTRTLIDVYGTDPQEFAIHFDRFVNDLDIIEKDLAVSIAKDNVSYEAVEARYNDLWKL